MTDYITTANFKTRHGITVATEDTRIAAHITAASLEIDAMCGRTFGQHSGAASARYFQPLDNWRVAIDDAYEISTVETDEGDDGTYETSWTVTTEYLSISGDNVNGLGINGQTGWPYTSIVAVGGRTFPTGNRRPGVKVTAKWGWTTTPTGVVEACYLLTHRLYYEVKVPSGVTPPNVEFGLPGSPLQRPWMVERLLGPYRRQTTRFLVG